MRRVGPEPCGVVVPSGRPHQDPAPDDTEGSAGNQQTDGDPRQHRELGAAVTVHGRTAAQSYSGTADWSLVREIAESLTIPVFGSGDCVTPEQIVEQAAEYLTRA